MRNGKQFRMRGVRRIASMMAMSLLIVAIAVPCMGAITLMIVTPAKAKEFGIQVRCTPSGSDAVSIEMEFPLTERFKRFVRVDLEMTGPPAGLKKGEEPPLLLSTTLRDERPMPDRASVRVYASRSHVEQMTLRILSGMPSNYVGHDVRLKDFVDQEKPK